MGYDSFVLFMWVRTLPSCRRWWYESPCDLCAIDGVSARHVYVISLCDGNGNLAWVASYHAGNLWSYSLSGSWWICGAMVFGWNFMTKLKVNLSLVLIILLHMAVLFWKCNCFPFFAYFSFCFKRCSWFLLSLQCDLFCFWKCYRCLVYHVILMLFGIWLIL